MAKETCFTFIPIFREVREEGAVLVGYIGPVSLGLFGGGRLLERGRFLEEIRK